MSTNDLQHYGILGMRWGRRKNTVNTAYDKKLSVLAKSKSVTQRQDKLLFQEVTSPLAHRYAKAAGKVVARRAAVYMLERISYGKEIGKITKKIIAKQLMNVALVSTKDIVLNDLMAKSASKRYTSAGKKVDPRKKDTIFTKEQAIKGFVNTGIALIPAARFLATAKLTDIAKKRRQNQENFEKWGANILPQKAENVIWQSDDLKTAVLN